jgi:hypothetical protein
MTSKVSVYARFETLVKNLLQAEKFEAHIPQQITQPSADFIIQFDNSSIAIEAKLYSSRSVSFTTALQAIYVLDAARRAHNLGFGVLIVGTYVSKFVKGETKKNFPAIAICDLNEISSFTFSNTLLFEELQSIIRNAKPFSQNDNDGQVTEITPTSFREFLANFTASVAPAAEATAGTSESRNVSRKGHELCEALKAVPVGLKYAKKFEEMALAAIEYIFKDDLTAWSPQKATDSKISIFDVVARIAITEEPHDFWTTVLNQFRSRYIIFEFKNHTGLIKQGQIYTTEKYLYLTALRSTAIIITRKGGDKNALSAARGALREHGKLILILTVDDICAMLHYRDKGEDYNKPLVEKLDDMLIKLER